MTIPRCVKSVLYSVPGKDSNIVHIRGYLSIYAAQQSPHTITTYPKNKVNGVDFDTIDYVKEFWVISFFEEETSRDVYLGNAEVLRDFKQNKYPYDYLLSLNVDKNTKFPMSLQGDVTVLNVKSKLELLNKLDKVIQSYIINNKLPNDI